MAAAASAFSVLSCFDDAFRTWVGPAAAGVSAWRVQDLLWPRRVVARRRAFPRVLARLTGRGCQGLPRCDT